MEEQEMQEMTTISGRYMYQAEIEAAQNVNMQWEEVALTYVQAILWSIEYVEQQMNVSKSEEEIKLDEKIQREMLYYFEFRRKAYSYYDTGKSWNFRWGDGLIIANVVKDGIVIRIKHENIMNTIFIKRISRLSIHDEDKLNLLADMIKKAVLVAELDKEKTVKLVVTKLDYKSTSDLIISDGANDSEWSSKIAMPVKQSDEAGESISEIVIIKDAMPYMQTIMLLLLIVVIEIYNIIIVKMIINRMIILCDKIKQKVVEIWKKIT